MITTLTCETCHLTTTKVDGSNTCYRCGGNIDRHPAVPPSAEMHDPALLGDAIKTERCRILEMRDRDIEWPRVYEQKGAPVTAQTTQLHRSVIGRVPAWFRTDLEHGRASRG